MASLHDQIKNELLQELYGSVDRIYDSLEQHFELDDIRRDTIIRVLNDLKDNLYLLSRTTPLS